jgi:imidazolonepropionase
MLSLRLAMNMACTLFRLTPAEALRGATINAARALGLADRGTLEAGRRADFVVWEIDHPADLCYWIGGDFVREAFAGGQSLTTRVD